MEPIERLDAAILRVEKAVVAGMLLVMGGAVFLDVMQRVSTREGSVATSPVFWLALGTVVGMLALRTRNQRQWAAKGVGIGLGLTVAQIALVRAFPNGLIWSQPLALALTLWLGTIGASLAASGRRHLALDVGNKIWPAAIAPKVAAMGHVVTAAFCLLVLWLSTLSVSQHFDLWVQTEHQGDVLSGTRIPNWTAAAAIPYGMLMLTFRFLLEAVRTWTGRVAIGGDDTLHQLGIHAEPPQ